MIEKEMFENELGKEKVGDKRGVNIENKRGEKGK